MIWRALGIAWCFALAGLSAAHGCTCSQAPAGLCAALEKDDVTFLGTVMNIDSTAPAAAAPDASAASQSADPPIRYHFRVDERFAGPDAPELDVYSGGDCGYRFEKGRQYIVFMQQSAGGQLMATICSRTRPASDGQALLPQLRAMRDGERVASVFGVLRRAPSPDSAPDDPGDALPNINLRLRSRFDLFETSTGPGGVYSFYDVHAGRYLLTAKLPARMRLTDDAVGRHIPGFKIPNGACYEYNMEVAPARHVRHRALLALNRKPSQK